MAPNRTYKRLTTPERAAIVALLSIGTKKGKEIAAEFEVDAAVVSRLRRRLTSVSEDGLSTGASALKRREVLATLGTKAPSGRPPTRRRGGGGGGADEAGSSKSFLLHAFV